MYPSFVNRNRSMGRKIIWALMWKQLSSSDNKHCCCCCCCCCGGGGGCANTSFHWKQPTDVILLCKHSWWLRASRKQPLRQMVTYVYIYIYIHTMWSRQNNLYPPLNQYSCIPSTFYMKTSNIWTKAFLSNQQGFSSGFAENHFSAYPQLFHKDFLLSM